jgi:hypothetical protein
VADFFTISDMRDRICAAEPGRDPAEVLNQLRGLHQRGLLAPKDNAAPRGAWRFTLDEILIARVLLAFVDNQQQSSALTAVRDELTALGNLQPMRAPSLQCDGGASRRGNNLAVAKAGALLGEDWLCVLVGLRVPAGHTLFNAFIDYAPDALTYQRALQFAQSHGCKLEAMTIVSMTRLIAPLLRA